MSNEQIILSNRVFLMEEGLLKGTGERFLFEDEKGSREIELPEEIHTFDTWKKMGFVVRRGEKAIAKFPIWKRAVKKKNEKGANKAPTRPADEQEDDEGTFYQKVSYFFTRGQVEPLNG